MRQAPTLLVIALLSAAALLVPGTVATLAPTAAAAEGELAAGAGATAPARSPRWSEAPAIVPLDAKGVVLEKATVQVEAPARGPIQVTTRYTLANARDKAANVRVALPLRYRAPVDYLDTTATVEGPAGPDDVSVTLGSAPPVEVPASALERIELPADGPLGVPATALAFRFEIDSYAATEVTVRQSVAWSPVSQPRHFPLEKGFSIGFVGLSAWGEGRESVEVSVAGEPALLGPATVAAPQPYRYDSKGVQWALAPGEDGAALAVPPRFTVVTLADWDRRSFAGPYYARYEVTPDDEYPWDHRFFHADPVTTAEGRPGRKVLRLATVAELIRTLDEMEKVILARNGKPFDDTFAQMRFQKESWYRPDPTFSEDSVKPVEKWNLDYARCSARAARTVQSALEKMKDAEVDASGRSFKMLLEAFRRCDDQYWDPKPATTERPLLQ